MMINKKGKPGKRRNRLANFFLVLSIIIIISFIFKELLDIYQNSDNQNDAAQVVILQNDAEIFKSGFLLCGGVFFLFFGLFLIVPFILPSSSRNDYIKTFGYLLQFLSGFHGEPVIINEGKRTKPVGKNRSRKATVVIADLNSAFVVEKKLINSPKLNEFDIGIDENRFAYSNGPGISYLSSDETILDVVDLRTQFRIKLNVIGKTRDSIELTTHVFTLFSLSQTPEEILISDSGEKEKGLRIIEVSSEKPNQRPLGNQVNIISDFRPREELDEDDWFEIETFNEKWESFADKWVENGPIESNVGDFSAGKPPYEFFPERVKAAVFSMAKSALSHNRCSIT